MQMVTSAFDGQFDISQSGCVKRVSSHRRCIPINRFEDADARCEAVMHIDLSLYFGISLAFESPPAGPGTGASSLDGAAGSDWVLTVSITLTGAGVRLVAM